MALIKIRNEAKAIIFVDSLNLTIRPKEVRLFDENTAKNDAQLMQCVIAGALAICGMDEDFDQKKEEVAEKKEIKEEQEVFESFAANLAGSAKQEQVEDVATPEQIKEAKTFSANRQKEIEDRFEPKNTTPVVMFGERPSRAMTLKQSDTELPNYINPDDIIGATDDGVIDDVPEDIVFADKDEQIAFGQEGVADARD